MYQKKTCESFKVISIDSLVVYDKKYYNKHNNYADDIVNKQMRD